MTDCAGAVEKERRESEAYFAMGHYMPWVKWQRALGEEVRICRLFDCVGL